MLLFSDFEPQAFIGLPLNWLVGFILMLRVPVRNWVRKSELRYTLKRGVMAVKSELMAVSPPFTITNNILLPISIFIIIFTLNFRGLLPYVFPSSGHIPFAISLALPLWVGHMLYGWVSGPQHILAHLVPLGSPGLLIPFIVLIEIVRSIIRPLTLSVRLVANIVAGHLLLTLLRRGARSVGLILLSLVILALFSLRCLETAVATIQAYVFTILSTLYVSEVESLNKNQAREN